MHMTCSSGSEPGPPVAPAMPHPMAVNGGKRICPGRRAIHEARPKCRYPRRHIGVGIMARSQLQAAPAQAGESVSPLRRLRGPGNAAGAGGHARHPRQSGSEAARGSNYGERAPDVVIPERRSDESAAATMDRDRHGRRSAFSPRQRAKERVTNSPKRKHRPRSTGRGGARRNRRPAVTEILHAGQRMDAPRRSARSVVPKKSPSRKTRRSARHVPSSRRPFSDVGYATDPATDHLVSDIDHGARVS